MPIQRRSASSAYDWQHRRMRDQWRRIVEAGNALCLRCQEPIEPGLPGPRHIDDRTGWLGAAHAACNRSAGGRRGAEVTHARAKMTIRRWGER